MALTSTDWEITRSSGNIRYIGGDHDSTGGTPSYATVIQFHRWLQELADDAVASGDDELDITNTDPSRRSTDNIITLINGYNITDAEAEHLYDGSIIQSSGDDIYDGIVNFGNSDVQIQVIQNGAVLTDDWWNYSAAGLNPDATAGISHRFMIKTRTGGTDVDGRRLIGTCRRYTYTYSEFSINGTARGNNVLALTDSSDLNNETIEGTVSGWTTIDNTTEGYAAIDVNNDSTDEYYYSEWNRDTYTINQFYERMKWLSRDASVSTIYGISGELFRGITHQVNLNTAGTNSLTFSAFEAVSWTGGTGQMFAIEDTTASAADTMWIQLLTGVVPGTAVLITGVTSTATATTADATATVERTIAKPFCGQSTGSAIIGAYGFGIEKADLASTDKVTDLGDNVITPPNNVTNTVSGLVSTEDRVLVAPRLGTDTNGDPAINKSQMALNTALSTTVTSVVIGHANGDVATIPSDTPSSGFIRVTSDTGFETRVAYTSWSDATFTITSTDFSGADVTASVGVSVYIAYIDELASATTATFTSVQDASRDLVLIVRDGAATPIKQYISSWTQTNSDQSINVIRTTDT